MISQGDTQSLNPEVVVIQEDLSSPPAVHPDRPKTECTACGTLHQVRECPAMSSVCFKCNKQGHFSRLCHATTINAQFQ